MPPHPFHFPARPFAGFAAVTLACAGLAGLAQSPNKGVELHAKSDITAADIGIPAFPGATPYKEPGSDSGAVDLGLTFGDFHFRVLAASYLTTASPAQVLDFYRKPLSRYGEVLECDHGKPVGAIKVARGGLTCSSSEGDHMQAGSSPDSATDHELRAGTPHHYRIVGIDQPKGGSTHFGVVEVELPKDAETGKKSD